MGGSPGLHRLTHGLGHGCGVASQGDGAVDQDGIGAHFEGLCRLAWNTDAVLVNSAIALAGDPAAMAEAMGQAVMAGRTAHLSGRLPRRDQASASSPTTGLVQSPQ